MVLEKGQVEAILCTSALPWGRWGCKICSYKLRSAVDMLWPFACCGDVGQCTSLKSRTNPKIFHNPPSPISSHDFSQGIMWQPHWCLPVVSVLQPYHPCLPLPFPGSPLLGHLPWGFLPPLYVFTHSISIIHSICHLYLCLYLNPHPFLTPNIYIHIHT